MKMVYRGVRYTATPAYMNVTDGSTVGQYRGAKLKFHQPAKLPVVQQIFHLMYRGVAFDEVVAG